jgi:hypothetical protein
MMVDRASSSLPDDSVCTLVEGTWVKVIEMRETDVVIVTETSEFFSVPCQGRLAENGATKKEQEWRCSFRYGTSFALTDNVECSWVGWAFYNGTEYTRVDRCSRVFPHADFGMLPKDTRFCHMSGTSGEDDEAKKRFRRLFKYFLKSTTMCPQERCPNDATHDFEAAHIYSTDGQCALIFTCRSCNGNPDEAKILRQSVPYLKLPYVMFRIGNVHLFKYSKQKHPVWWDKHRLPKICVTAAPTTAVDVPILPRPGVEMVEEVLRNIKELRKSLASASIRLMNLEGALDNAEYILQKL